MTLRSIQPAAIESHWRLFSIRKSDERFKQFQHRVFERDEYTCQYCGFCATANMEVINTDGNYRNNHLSNLTTACHFCAQCFFLDGVGKGDYGGGVMIYLPEMPQNELNAFCHVLFAMILGGGRIAADAKAVYRNLRLRTQYVEKELGKGLSNPSTYGQLLIDSGLEKKEQLHDALMRKIRILPQMTRYVNQIYQWNLSAIKAMSELK